MTKGRLHHRSLNLRSTERVQRLELVQFRVQVICVAQGTFELVLLNPSLNSDLCRSTNLMDSYWLIEHRAVPTRRHFSCQPGSHAVAANSCFSIGWKAGPAGQQARVSADVIAMSFIKVAIFRSCKDPRFSLYTDRIMLQETAGELCDIAQTVDGERWTSRGGIVRETRCRRISWVRPVVLHFTSSAWLCYA